MDLNHETILEQLLHFDNRSNGSTTTNTESIPDMLERYLEYVARTGDTLFPWHKIKGLIKKKTEISIDDFDRQNPSNTIGSIPNVPNFNFHELRDEILSTIDSFYGAPFTIQRICELITSPNRHYKRTDKFMRGLEKNILVVSYIEPRLSIGEQPTPPVMAPSYHPFSLSSVAGSSGYIANGSPSSPNAPAPLQQLDSFTTVFSSPPSTPLAVVSDMPPYDDGSSSSSSSGSSAESSPSTHDSLEHNSNGIDSIANLGDPQPMLTPTLGEFMSENGQQMRTDAHPDDSHHEPEASEVPSSAASATTDFIEAMEVSGGGSSEDLTRLEHQELQQPTTSSAVLNAIAPEVAATLEETKELEPISQETLVKEDPVDVDEKIPSPKPANFEPIESTSSMDTAEQYSQNESDSSSLEGEIKQDESSSGSSESTPQTGEHSSEPVSFEKETVQESTTTVEPEPEEMPESQTTLETNNS